MSALESGKCPAAPRTQVRNDRPHILSQNRVNKQSEKLQIQARFRKTKLPALLMSERLDNIYILSKKKKNLNCSCYRGKKKINFFKLSNLLDTRTMQNDMSAEWGALYTTHTTPIFIPAESTRIWRYTQYYFSMLPIYSSLHFEIHILSLWQSKKMKGVEEKKIKLVEKKY